MMATVQYVTSGSGLRKFQADGFLLERVYHSVHKCLHLIVAIDTDNFPRKHSRLVFVMEAHCVLYKLNLYVKFK